MADLTSAAPGTTNNDSDKTNSSPQSEAARNTRTDQTGEGGVEMAAQHREPEKALETHEVVEINKFTERKEWIEDKIKLLESMPPIEVFAGVEALISLSEELPPGLPTRAELDHWLEEHDKTEKETEIFDAEDMSKLKKLTKAATQRNLSPEDTDLIELTLTTLLALDRLLHLLRDRSDTLDLLSLRLTWEEQRVTAWRERRSLINDLDAFLTTRARWSLETYEHLPPSTPSPSQTARFTSPSPSPSPRPSSSLAKRRDSAASLASISSDTSSSTTGPSAAFSRSTRYKLAELLSHDAALFSGRLTTLNHSKVMAAGKTLDKLIDASRKPVPDVILDEQDRLEDKAIKEIESVGKFAMAVVMQWKRADEHYNDTIKDQSAAQALMAELDNAKLQHPTPRYDAAFTLRAQALTKRLAVKGDPALPRSSFPRPVHPLFPEQAASNEAIINTLSTELAEAVGLARQAEATAQAYHARLEIVKWTEMLNDQIRNLDRQLESLADKLTKGIQEGHDHGDASPPNLDDEICLDPTRHATFLALLPSIMQEYTQKDQVAERALRDGNTASMRLKDLPGIEATLKTELATAMQKLEVTRDTVRRMKENTLARAQRLKEARCLWNVLNDIMNDVEVVRNQVLEGIEGQRWRAPLGRLNGAPITPDPDSPELPHAPLPVTSAPHVLLLQLDTLTQRLSAEFGKPLTQLLSTLEEPLSVHLQLSSDSLAKHIDDLRSMSQLWDRIFRQAEAMAAVQHDARELQYKVDALQADADDARQSVLQSDRGSDGSTALEADLSSRAAAMQESVQTFANSLAVRIPLVSSVDNSRSRYSRSTSLSGLPSSADHMNRLKAPLDLALPFDVSALDNDVRAEGNSLALKLAGRMQLLAKKLDYLRLSLLAKAIDYAAEDLSQELNSSSERLAHFKVSLETGHSTVEHLGVDATLSEKITSMIERFDQFAQDHCAHISRHTSLVQQSLHALQAAPSVHDSPVHGTILIPRVKFVNDALHRTELIAEAIVQLRTRIMETKSVEDNRLRLEKERLETEENLRIESERLKAEKEKQEEFRLQAERVKLEHERLDAEQRASSEAARRGEGQRKRAGTVVPDAAPPKTPDEDVFGRRLTPAESSIIQLSSQLTGLRARIVSLQTRLRSLSLSSLVRPSLSYGEGTIPSLKDASETHSRFSALVKEMAILPTAVEEDSTIDSELQSLRSEFDAARTAVHRLLNLGQICEKAAACDHALSDLLEHADVYPAAPSANQLASCHISDPCLPCEEQLANRLAFTKGIVDEMVQACVIVVDDLRVTAERTRLQQTWSEIADMCADRINGTRSRPASSVSSAGRSSGAASVFSVQRKPKPSLGGHGPHPRPRENLTRRAPSGAHELTNQPHTHMSNRSVSGPSGSSSLFNTTFASRQRTSSLASIQSATTSPFKRPMSPIIQPRMTFKQPGSPTFSETSGHSLASTPSRSTWSRAPRQSFGTVPRNFQPHDTTIRRKAYVANPKSKLDVAVGNVVNNFRLPVTVQAAGDGWRDQSGKYWIGDAEPKLCFCRILRSQTVMVRVGGGWCELSKFLRGHFADLLAELPPSPPRKEERWISAATVRKAMENSPSAAQSRTTPEPQAQSLLPSFQLSTPNGTSPQSLKASPSPGAGSPGLTPFQFMRRADVGLRPGTPSPTKSTRTKPVTPGGSATATPLRTNIWRP